MKILQLALLLSLLIPPPCYATWLKPVPKKTATIVSNVMPIYEGVPYVWGASSTGGTDCSGFSRFIYKHYFGIDLPHSSRVQAHYGLSVPLNALQPFDLLFFGRSRVNHVGIYLGNGQMIHASSGYGEVTICDLWKYSRSLVDMRRLLTFNN